MNKNGAFGKKGSITVEAAFLLPLLSLLFVGLMEFGEILMIKQAMTNAARESTRVAAVNLSDTAALSSAETVAQDYLGRSGIDLAQVLIVPEFSEVSGSQAVKVTIRYHYASNLSAWIPGIPNALDLVSQVTMRREA